MLEGASDVHVAAPALFGGLQLGQAGLDGRGNVRGEISAKVSACHGGELQRPDPCNSKGTNELPPLRPLLSLPS
eukprot:4229313-Lingulodinium_polyedra.AAC.1